MRRFRSMLVSSACVLLPSLAAADEGMWTYDHFPSATVRQKFGVEITPQWLDRVRLATVRLSNCTATFVSRDGLILTNHHCIDACLAENSSREKSLLEDGFLAATRPQELRCGAQLADVLVAMEDVTAKVDAATRGMDGTNAKQARRQTLTALEAACEKAAAVDRKTGALKCQAVTLYAGGQYFLYKYHRYSDVRLVFAPESGIANFGGDPDNFQFPRWNLDMGMLRAYENGKPARIANPLHIDFAGPATGEMVLVSGHPGSTDRLLTLAQLDLQRDTALPQILMRSSELRGRYIQFAKTGEAARRIVQEPLESLENSIKVRRRQLDALLDGALIAQKQRDEADLRNRVAARPDLAQLGSAWSDIEGAARRGRELYTPYVFLEGGAGFNSRLFSYARLLVRAADERTRPDGDRLREYTDTRLPRLQQQLSATIPVYPELERLTLSFGLERMREWLGPDNATVRRLLASDSPDSLAGRLVEGSQLGDPAVRLALWNGGAAAIAASSDPMIQLARSVDAEARAIRTRYENEVEAPQELAAERIARARFALLGTDVYPDATFTLRLNFGTVQGWVENGQPVAPFTRLQRAFERATGQDPFRIPANWLAAKPKLDLQAPFNFSTNNDIVGGNSGSALLNAKGDVVGLMFDGNIHSISGSYWFDSARNRGVAVHPAIMREALEKVYGAKALLAELAQR